MPAAAPDLGDILFEHADAVPNAAAIGFELRFARAPRADAAAEPRHLHAEAGQPRQQVLQLRQLDLQPAFARLRAPGEDVENDFGAIDHAPAQNLFEVARLRGREHVVENRDCRADFVARERNLFSLAASDQRGRLGARPLLRRAQHDDGAGRFGEAGQFVEREIGIGATRGAGEQTDERSALGG